MKYVGQEPVGLRVSSKIYVMSLISRLFLVAKVVREKLFWRGAGGQCYIMLAGLCDFALERPPKLIAGSVRITWFIACVAPVKRGTSPIVF